VALVTLSGRIAVDLFRGRRRLARVPVADAASPGTLLRFDTLGEPTVRLRWRNPGGGLVSHDYAVGATSLSLRG
jgi:hypothetical protein